MRLVCKIYKIQYSEKSLYIPVEDEDEKWIKPHPFLKIFSKRIFKS
jgi:hypothetical protein